MVGSFLKFSTRMSTLSIHIIVLIMSRVYKQLSQTGQPYLDIDYEKKKNYSVVQEFSDHPTFIVGNV